jgi:transcriptional regulator with XRE-family HTH domain
MVGLGALVRDRRLRLGWTQAELADRVSTSSQHISQIETGARKWPREIVPELADALGLSEVEMAMAAGLISPQPVRQPTPLDDPVVRQICEEVAHLDDRARAHVLDVITFLRGGDHGAPARRLTSPRAEPGDAGHRRTG